MSKYKSLKSDKQFRIFIGYFSTSCDEISNLLERIYILTHHGLRRICCPTHALQYSIFKGVDDLIMFLSLKVSLGLILVSICFLSCNHFFYHATWLYDIFTLVKSTLQLLQISLNTPLSPLVLFIFLK